MDNARTILFLIQFLNIILKQQSGLYITILIFYLIPPVRVPVYLYVNIHIIVDNKEFINKIIRVYFLTQEFTTKHQTNFLIMCKKYCIRKKLFL